MCDALEVPRIALAILLAVAACSRLPPTHVETFASVAKRLQESRGVTFDLPKLTVLTRAQWIERLGEPDGWQPDYDAIWKAMGFVGESAEPSEDFRAVERRFDGYYNFDEHEVVYITDTPIRERQMAHSLVHAMQRERSPLYDLPALGGHGDDVGWAYTVAREAEAISYELAWPDASIDSIDPDQLRFPANGLAPYAVRWAYFGYVVGARYLRARFKGSLRETCDAIWKNPPLSTEQALHPERNDPPIAVFAPDLSMEMGKGWRLVVTTVLGEWTIADWIGFGQPKIDGGLPDDLRWGGDVAQVYRNKEDERTILVWTVWDDDASARNFDERLRGVKVHSGKVVAVAFGGSTELLRAGLKKLRAVPFRTVEELEAAIESE